MKHTYSPKSFGLLIGRTTNSLQRWDRAGILIAHRSVTGRRYYTHDQYLQVIGQKTKERKITLDLGINKVTLDSVRFILRCLIIADNALLI